MTRYILKIKIKNEISIYGRVFKKIIIKSINKMNKNVSKTMKSSMKEQEGEGKPTQARLNLSSWGPQGGYMAKNFVWKNSQTVDTPYGKWWAKDMTMYY